MADDLHPSSGPFLAPAPHPEWVIRWVARLAVAATIGYLAYRVAFTLDGASPLGGGLLVVAEVLGGIVFVARVRSAVTRPLSASTVPDSPRLEVDAVVDATGASINDFRATLVSCQRVVGLGRVFVADADASPELRPIAQRFGAVMLPAGLDAGTALRDSDAAWLLTLDAGHLPMPDLIEFAAGHAASDVGIVQVGTEEVCPSGRERGASRRWSLTPFEDQVVRPSLAARGSIPWCGDGPALVRPQAVRDAGPASTPVEMGLHAISSGYRVTMVPRTLAGTQGPPTLTESLAARRSAIAPVRRAARGPLDGIPRGARIAHRLAILAPLSAAQRVVLVATAVTVMGLGQSPFAGSTASLAIAAGSAYGLRWITHLLLGRGRLGPFSVLRAEIRSLAIDLHIGAGTPDALRRQARVVLAAMAAVVTVATLVAMAAYVFGGDGGLSGGETAVALLLGTAFVAATVEVLRDMVTTHQRRQHRRERLARISCRLKDLAGDLADLSVGGAGVVLDVPIELAPEAGTTAMIAFRIPVAGDVRWNVSTVVRVVHVRTTDDGKTRAGLAFDDPSAPELDRVVEFLTVDRRLDALGRRSYEPVRR